MEGADKKLHQSGNLETSSIVSSLSHEVLVEWRDPHTNREQFVDARLVAEALMHVGHVDRQDDPRSRGRHVLALCTGDGNLEGQAPGRGVPLDEVTHRPS